MTHADPTFWLLARASGLTAYVLLSATVLAGLVLKSRPLGTRLKAATVTDLHRFLSTLALGAIAIHALTLLLDTTIKLNPLALLVPGLSSYRPLAVGAGVVALELMLLVAFSFPLRKRLGVKNWRRLHWSTYGIFALATAHGLLAGTDSLRLLPLYASSLAAVVFAAAWRALVPPQTARPARAMPRPPDGQAVAAYAATQISTTPTALERS